MSQHPHLMIRKAVIFHSLQSPSRPTPGRHLPVLTQKSFGLLWISLPQPARETFGTAIQDAGEGLRPAPIIFRSADLIEAVCEFAARPIATALGREVAAETVFAHSEERSWSAALVMEDVTEHLHRLEFGPD